MACKNKKCLYIMYLKSIPIIDLCYMIANNKVKCEVCGEKITMDDILNYEKELKK